MRHQRGFSIIAVVFILVVLAGLAGVIAQLGASQHLGTLMAQEGRQAWYAARAGLEWGRHTVLHGGGCSSGTLVLADFSVSVTCHAHAAVSEGDANLAVFQLESVATRDHGVLGQVRREARMSIWSEL